MKKNTTSGAFSSYTGQAVTMGKQTPIDSAKEEAYDRLLLGILNQAKVDYTTIMTGYPKVGSNTHREPLPRVIEVLKFMRSSWCAQICEHFGYTAEEFKAACDKHVEEVRRKHNDI